ncbi:MAG: hypothetical protein HY899_05535 [Deltaproteobacteria bacterium]|nr:hypothetical protein [Deltaproteobacteria bacterium]
MAADSDKERRWAMESFLGRLGELRVVLGDDVVPVLDRVRAELLAGLAARDRGDLPEAGVRLARAMAELATLGDRLGDAEGALMRVVTAEFIRSMAHGDADAMERGVDRIQARAGTPKKRP